MHWYIQVLKKFDDFDGRARRKEYWMFNLIDFIFVIIISFIDTTIFNTSFSDYGPIFIVYTLVTFIPALAVSVRRMHDVGKSGWFIFVGVIPIIGWIWIFIVLITDSELFTNKYGPNPKVEEELIEDRKLDI